MTSSSTNAFTLQNMAAGLPVVASRIGQLEQLIKPDVNGLLTKPGDAAELAMALEKLKADPQWRAQLGKAARKLVLQEHTWDMVVERILSVASSIVPSCR